MSSAITLWRPQKPSYVNAVRSFQKRYGYGDDFDNHDVHHVALAPLGKCFRPTVGGELRTAIAELFTLTAMRENRKPTALENLGRIEEIEIVNQDDLALKLVANTHRDKDILGPSQKFVLRATRYNDNDGKTSKGSLAEYPLFSTPTALVEKWSDWAEQRVAKERKINGPYPADEDNFKLRRFFD